MRTGGFPTRTERLDASAERRLRKRSDMRFDRVLSSPDPAARQTAEALADEPEIVEALHDMDHGAWADRLFADVHAEKAAAFEAWLAQPWKGTPDGESFIDVRARVSAWIDCVIETDETLAIVTHPMVVRGFLACTIGLPADAVMRIDIAPLTATTLSRHRRVWRLQRLGETFFDQVMN